MLDGGLANGMWTVGVDDGMTNGVESVDGGMGANGGGSGGT